MRIGIDWGGTKIELIALDDNGDVLLREREATPKNDYTRCLEAVGSMIARAEGKLGQAGTVGIGIPGTISPATGLVKNANSTWLNGQPLKQDLERLIERDVRIQNDANCLAVSEAVDGAGEGANLVAGIIIGTGCGCGIAIKGRALFGRHGIAGEFGHTPLPWPGADEAPGEKCWCGQYGCIETFVSGTGFQRDFANRVGEDTLRAAEEILKLGTPESEEAYRVYCHRLARGLAMLINILDPDVIVLGGGMSNVSGLYKDVPPLTGKFVFSDVFDTPLLPAKHGDSSGVRGAAWLW